MILYMENSIEWLRNCWTNKFSKDAGYNKINIQKSIVSTYSSSKQAKNEIEKTIQL